MKSRIGATVIILALGLFFNNPCLFGQLVDTIKIETNNINYSKNIKEVKYHSPHKASMYAAVIPGLGQIYNKKYWKLPIVYAGFGGVAYAVQFNSFQYDRYRSAYRDFLIRDPQNKSYLDIIANSPLTEEEITGPYADWFQRTLDNRRKYYRRYRDISYAGIVAVYLVQIIDATVDAHFKYFDISDDLSLNIEPVVLPNKTDNSNIMGLQLKFSF